MGRTNRIIMSGGNDNKITNSNIYTYNQARNYMLYLNKNVTTKNNNMKSFKTNQAIYFINK
jgi:hypothetical protein